MSSPAVQLSFSLRTSSSVRSVHLVGSWDNYQRQLPLSVAAKGQWKGTFRFQGSQSLKLGGRYWYYYIIDGYQVTHDSAKDSVTEKTTGRKLNVLNVPAATKAPVAKPALAVNTKVATADQTHIVCPRPQKPYASRGLREADYEVSPIEDLEERFSAARLSPAARSYMSSPSELSDASSSGAEFSDVGSNTSRSACTCGRVGVTRDGRRVKLDCGGKRCNAVESDSDCSDSEAEIVSKQVQRAARAAQASRRSAVRRS